MDAGKFENPITGSREREIGFHSNPKSGATSKFIKQLQAIDGADGEHT